MMKNPAPTEVFSHDEAWSLLPWFATGGLSAEENAGVQAHLLDCAECQRELARCEQLNHSVKSNNDQLWTPSARHFSHVLAGVDSYEARSAKPQNAVSWIERWFPWLSATPRPARLALGLQGAFVIALGSLLLFRVVAPTETYRTLSNPSVQVTTTGQQIRIVFADDMTEKGMRDLLLATNAQLVSGPSSLGVYTITIDAGTLHAKGEKDIIARLRDHPKVKFAEIVYSARE